MTPFKACGIRIGVQPDPSGGSPSNQLFLRQANCRRWGCAFCSSWLRALYEERLTPLLEREPCVHLGFTTDALWEGRAGGRWRRRIRPEKRSQREGGRYRAFLLRDGQVGVLATEPLDPELGRSEAIPRGRRRTVLRELLCRMRNPERTSTGRSKSVHSGSREWRFEREEESTGRLVGWSSDRLAWIRDRAERCPLVEVHHSAPSETAPDRPEELERVDTELKDHQYLESVLGALGVTSRPLSTKEAA